MDEREKMDYHKVIQDFEDLNVSLRDKVKDILSKKDVVVKGSPVGKAINMVLEAIDEATCLEIFSEVLSMRSKAARCARAYESVSHKVINRQRELEALQEKIKRLEEERDTIYKIEDDVIRNAVILYRNIYNTYIGRTDRLKANDAMEVTKVYLMSQGKQVPKEMFTTEGDDADA